MLRAVEQEDVHINGAEAIAASLSGAMIGATVGFFLLHGIPASAAIAFITPGIASGLGGAVIHLERAGIEWRQRFADGA